MNLTEEQLERIAEVAQTANNLLGALELPLPAHLHLEGCRGNIQDMRDELRKIVVELKGEDPWEGVNILGAPSLARLRITDCRMSDKGEFFIIHHSLIPYGEPTILLPLGGTSGMALNLEEALEVLKRHRHRSSDTWAVVRGLRHVQVRAFHDSPSPEWLTEFETIAIAEKYQRDAAPGADHDES
ncbi:MAG TPA: hypothetical protein VHU19_14355 [Pyrinomonadaceae bacterium]|nr:hypothetical protein [Pyrinomonadaceae bacterium]